MAENEKRYMTAGSYFESRSDMISVKTLVDMKSFRIRNNADLQKVANYLGIPNEHRPNARKLKWLIDEIKQALPRLLDVKTRNITKGMIVNVFGVGEGLEISCIQRDGLVRFKGRKACFNPFRISFVGE